MIENQPNAKLVIKDYEEIDETHLRVYCTNIDQRTPCEIYLSYTPGKKILDLLDNACRWGRIVMLWDLLLW